MRRAFRFIRWAVEGLALATVLLVAAGYAYTLTDHFRRFARDQIVALLATTFQGEVTFARLEGSPWGDLALDDVVVRNGADVSAEIPRVHATFSLVPLFGRELRIARLEIERPVLRLTESARGTWNLLDALATRPAPRAQPETAGGGELEIVIESLAIRDGNVLVTTHAAAPRSYRLSPVALEGRIEVLAAGIEATVRTVRLHAAAEGLPPLDLDAALRYRAVGSPATLALDRLRATTADSELDLRAGFTAVDTPMQMEIRDARLSIVKLGAADLRRFAPQWKSEDPLTGVLSASGKLSDLRAELALDSGAATVRARLSGDVAAEKPRYDAAAEVANLDVARMLGGDVGAGIVSAKVKAHGAGTAPADATGDAQIDVRGLRAEQWQLGTLSLAAKLAGGRGEVDGRLENPGGSARLRASADITGAETYKMKLDVAHLNPEKAAPGRAPVRGSVTLQAGLEGTGFAVDRARARATVMLSPSRLGKVEIRRGRLEASIANRTLRLSKLTLDAKDASVLASGELPLDPAKPLRARYEAKVRDLAPWLALAEKSGRGSASISGTAAGTLSRPAVRARVDLTDVEVDGSELARAELQADLTNAAWPPRGTLTARLDDVRAGIALHEATAKVTLGGAVPERATIAVAIRDTADRRHELAAEAVYASPRVALRVNELSLQAPDGKWTLTRPAEIRQQADHLTIAGLEIEAESGGKISVDGDAGATGAQRLRLSIEQFPLESIRPLVDDLPEISGRLGMQADLSGTAAAPKLSLATEVRELRIAGQSYAGLDGRVQYDATRAALELRFDQDAEHRLTASGKVPFVARWDPAFEARPTGDVELTARSSGLSLAFLNAFLAPRVQKIDGRIVLDVAVRGPVDGLRPSGTLGLEGGRAAIAPLGVEIDEAAVDVGFDGSAVQLRRLALRSGEGKIDGAGDVALSAGAPDRGQLWVSFERWPAAATPRYQATVDGKLTVGGRVAAPVIGGEIELSDVLLKPDIEFLTKQPTERDATIRVVGGGASGAPAPARTDAPREARKPDAYRAATIDVNTKIRRNSWLKHPSATVELEGEMRARKPPQQDLALTGEIRTVRGWGELQGRRFTVSEGKIAFTGGATIDPSLDVVAEYRKGEYTIDALVGGKASAPSLELQSQPSLSQADILAVLLFGKPTTALSDGQKSDLKQKATEIGQAYAITAIGNQVVHALGLEAAGVQVEELSSEKVTLGKYVTENTYVTASQGLQGERGEEVGVEYQFRPNWGVRTSTSSTGSSGVDLIWKKRY